MTDSDTALVWLRRDLRLHDNPALAEACRLHCRVLPVFVYAPEEEGDWAPGAASRWWLHQALNALATDFAARGMALTLRHGDSAAELRAIARQCGANRVYCNALVEPLARQRDRRVADLLAGEGVVLQQLSHDLLCAPNELRTRSGKPYRVFTPLWRALQARLLRDPPLTESQPVMDGPPLAFDAAAIDALNLLPKPDWAQGLRDRWRVSEADALRQLDAFIDGAMADYAERRDYPAEPGCSRLSPYLAWGQLSPRYAWSKVQSAMASGELAMGAGESWLRQLAWREFGRHLLYHFPESVEQPLNRRFERFPWRNDATQLAAWQRGRTGVPLVDAGMHELWQTGWMHNRVRMVVASFLTKHLRLHWLDGARWFWDTLVDADLANNSLGWQWCAGCGADAAPYFRILNPLRQAERFDPSGAYVRRWLGEERLASPPTAMVDLAEARAASLACYRAMKDAAA